MIVQRRVANSPDSMLYECESAYLVLGQLPGQDVSHFRGDDPPVAPLLARPDSYPHDDGDRPLHADYAVVSLIGMLGYPGPLPDQMAPLGDEAAPLGGEIREPLV